MAYLTPRYDPAIVTASFLIASFASYVALDLAKRVRTPDRAAALGWWVGGSIAMGTGIWSMHFVGMLAYSLPIALGYTALFTFLSWLAGVAVSAVALGVASRGTLTLPRLALGAVAMGAGICTMHYIGMAALEMAPGIVWSIPLVAASAAIAVGASAAALLIFFWLRQLERGAAYWLAVCSESARRVVLSRMRASQRLQQANAALQERAFLDGLTGLPNRLLFEDRLMHAVARAERADARIGGRPADKIAVLFVDLDAFKPVNDSFGHSAGDLVLQEAARRLRAAARESDTVARIGGDEFVLLMEHVVSVADCVTLARRLIEVLHLPFSIAERQVQISGSVGIVVYPDHDGDKRKLMGHADAAMYAAKRAGGGSYALFEPHMDADAVQQLDLQSDLRSAVERGQLELHYQPKIDGRRGMITGAEALLRWNHPQRGVVGPAVFIPIAERFGVITSIGNWVIEEVCRQMRAWAEDGVRMRVAINLSVHQLRQDDLIERIGAALDRHQIEASQLLCEITESVAMEDLKATQAVFEGLQRIGVYLSIDDFGTGYSSLSYLRQMPARQLKIDRSFVNDLGTSADARAVVDAVIRLAHALGLRVVAEGVETLEQRDILLQLDCDELQGFYFARPMSAAMLFDWTAGRKPEGSVDFAPSVVDALAG